MLFQAVQQIGGKAEVALHKLLRILRAVHPRQIEDKIGLAAVFIQFFPCGIQIVLIDLINAEIRPGTILAIADIFQVGSQGGTHHPLCASD